MSDENIVQGEIYKKHPRVNCLLCSKAYVAMTYLSIDHVGTIYLCNRCREHLVEALEGTGK